MRKSVGGLAFFVLSIFGKPLFHIVSFFELLDFDFCFSTRFTANLACVVIITTVFSR